MAEAAHNAISDFQAARRRADIAAVLAMLSGQSDHLLQYDEVRRRLKAVESGRTTLEDVPLDAIVGSVGRYQDFNRSFLPLTNADRARWVGVKLAMTGLEGVPPIELYRIGDAYFVKDGNHRVSVARQLGASHINAYVTVVSTRVPFKPGMDQDDLIKATEFAEFLEATQLDELRPGADLSVTEPGQYPKLLEHIRVHRYFMGIDEGRSVSWDEAVTHFYDNVYLPVVEEIRAHGLLRDFPERTEADLYLYLSEHRGEVAERLGWELEGAQLAEGLARTPPATVDERAAALAGEDSRVLVDSELLILTGAASDAEVVRVGVGFAERERAQVFALWAPTGSADDGPLSKALAAANTSYEVGEAAARESLARACEAAGVLHQFAVAKDDLLPEVKARAPYVDLVVAATNDGLPGRRPVDPGVHSLLRRCPKPLLLVGKARGEFRRPLLAYDGGEKSEEALFALAYLAVRWNLTPVVLHVGRRAAGPDREVGEGGRSAPQDATLRRAGAYLERLGVKAELVSAAGPVAATIVRVARERGCGVIFLGSHSRPRWLEEVLGGIVDEVLETTDLPLLIT
jgi:nucleotide-binding universal stress UspA family protein